MNLAFQLLMEDLWQPDYVARLAQYFHNFISLVMSDKIHIRINKNINIMFAQVFNSQHLELISDSQQSLLPFMFKVSLPTNSVKPELPISRTLHIPHILLNF